MSSIITKDYSQASSWLAGLKQAKKGGVEAIDSYRYYICIIDLSALLVSIVALKATDKEHASTSLPPLHHKQVGKGNKEH